MEMQYQLNTTQIQLCFCMQVVNTLLGYIWNWYMVLCVCSSICQFFKAVHRLHFMHLYVPYTNAIIEESGLQLGK